MNKRVHLAIMCVIVTAVAAATTSASASPRTAPGDVRVSVPQLSWTGCDLVFQCATAKVPLDYDDPAGKTIDLALIKRPVGQPGSKIGTLFINPGGPGGNFAGTAGRVQFRAITAALGHRLGARFDMVGIDPRGTGGSTPLVCRAAPGVPPVSAPADAWPTGQQQYDHRFAYAAYMRASCAATGGDILDHMSTADQARDLDLIRRAVGDAQLSYYGLSYGSFLGATYAALYPGRVRAMVIDGVVDPIALATGRPGDENTPAWARVGSAEGAQETLDSVLARCDRAGLLACPLAGNAKGRWDRVRKSLVQQPISLPRHEAR